ncbi:MAG: methyltransferase domain-containing protein, partial [Mycobacteriaceae bacterium]|nr:methyltransferase domain-containing protein [Mycobacteriaceae bacterium]
MVGANPGYHQHLRLSARRMRLPGNGAGLRLLDAGCGTGASTAALLCVAPHAEIVAVDASKGMLDAALAKQWPASVRFVRGRIEALHELGIDGPFDAIFAAYLLRNLADPDAQLRMFRALLRPGGTLAVHEYSVRDSTIATWVWHAVSWGIIIPFGRRHTGDTT